MSEHAESASSQHDHVQKRGKVSPIGYLVLLATVSAVVAEIIMLNTGTGRDVSGSAYFLCGLVIGLAVALICVALSSFRRKRTVMGVFSILISFLSIGVATVAIMLATMFSGFSILSPPSLAQSLQSEANAAAAPIGAFLASGNSGPITTTSWSNPNGGSIPIVVSWARNAHGVLVTATPHGSIPKGQDGSPRSRQVLKNGMLAFPMDYFKQTGKESELSNMDQSGNMDLFGSFVLMFDEVSTVSGGAIIAWSKTHDGQLPDSSQASDLLSKAKNVFEFQAKAGPVSKTDPMLKFEIDSYTYKAGSEGIFSIEYAWTCPTATVSAYFQGDKVPVSGVLTIHYSTLGYIAMKSAGMPLEVILDDVMKEMQKQQKEMEDAAKKDGDADK